MASNGSPRRPALPKSIIFELEETLLDRRVAWCYAIEQAVGTVCRRRVDASPLFDEYYQRPVAQAMAVLVESLDERLECQRAWQRFFYRSALKKLLVHDGVGMALDRLLHAGVELGVASHEPHDRARKSLESTGLDRFLTVLAATPEGEAWDPTARIEQCLTFLGYGPERALFVSVDAGDVVEAREAGVAALRGAWGHDAAGGEGPAEIPAPGAIHDAAAALWRTLQI